MRSSAIAAPTAFGRCDAIVLVCGGIQSGTLPNTLWRPPAIGSSRDATMPSRMSNTRRLARHLLRALAEERARPVVEEREVVGTERGGDRGVPFVAGAADRVEPDVLRLEVAGFEVEVSRLELRIHEDPEGHGATEPGARAGRGPQIRGPLRLPRPVLEELHQVPVYDRGPVHCGHGRRLPESHGPSAHERGTPAPPAAPRRRRPGAAERRRLRPPSAASGHRQAAYLASAPQVDPDRLRPLLVRRRARARPSIPILHTRCASMPTVVYDKHVYGADARDSARDHLATLPADREDRAARRPQSGDRRSPPDPRPDRRLAPRRIHEGRVRPPRDERPVDVASPPSRPASPATTAARPSPPPPSRAERSACGPLVFSRPRGPLPLPLVPPPLRPGLPSPTSWSDQDDVAITKSCRIVVTDAHPRREQRRRDPRQGVQRRRSSSIPRPRSGAPSASRSPTPSRAPASASTARSTSP